MKNLFIKFYRWLISLFVKSETETPSSVIAPIDELPKKIPVKRERERKPFRIASRKQKKRFANIIQGNNRKWTLGRKRQVVFSKNARGEWLDPGKNCNRVKFICHK